ncbi:f-box/tpr repeat protein pof3 [Holotrichia oblita]|uniref:F-box/tpr repeat protein pof3 n=1 Tax=Holotrichia oblita TaxID=644536 RepID=A0ACB9T5I1_HOLOL|nr:f-box/tpr repeat protein pof3 [Holotrichia oblita]
MTPNEEEGTLYGGEWNKWCVFDTFSKRARYESPVKERWSLARNSISLHDVLDYGVSLLADSESECGSDEEKGCENENKTNSKQQMAVLQSTISTEMLRKVTQEEWETQLRKTAANNDVTPLNHFEELSDEMVLHVFHFLPKRVLNTAALVCKRWYRLTQDESLWARMDLGSRQLQPGALGQVLSRQVMILRLAQAEIASPAILPGCRAFSEDFKSRLLLLDLSMATVGCETLVELFTRCCRLKKVSLEHVGVNAKVLQALSCSKDLEVVNLSMVEGITEKGLKYLLGNCKSIRELNLAWTYMNSASVEYVSSNLPECLDRLNISGCRKLLNDDHILKLVRRCPSLRELDLSDTTSLTSDAIGHIAALQELNFLALSRCYQVSYSSLLQLKKIPTLMYLDVHGGYVDTGELRHLQENLGTQVQINKFKFSSVARPTVGTRRSSIWNMRVRD